MPEMRTLNGYEVVDAKAREEIEQLKNKEVDLTGYATEQWVENKGYLTTHQDITGKADKVHKHVLADITDYEAPDLSPYALRSEIPSAPDLSSYALRSEIPTVPTKISAFENDTGYLTEHQDISNLATKSEIPTIPTNVSAFNNDAGYLTEHQSLEGYAKTSDIPDVSNFASKSDIPSVEGLATEEYVDNAISEITTASNTMIFNFSGVSTTASNASAMNASFADRLVSGERPIVYLYFDDNFYTPVQMYISSNIVSFVLSPTHSWTVDAGGTNPRVVRVTDVSYIMNKTDEQWTIRRQEHSYAVSEVVE